MLRVQPLSAADRYPGMALKAATLHRMNVASSGDVAMNGIVPEEPAPRDG
jgi:hypothetical protein